MPGAVNQLNGSNSGWPMAVQRQVSYRDGCVLVVPLACVAIHSHEREGAGDPSACTPRAPGRTQEGISLSVFLPMLLFYCYCIQGDLGKPADRHRSRGHHIRTWVGGLKEGCADRANWEVRCHLLVADWRLMGVHGRWDARSHQQDDSRKCQDHQQEHDHTHKGDEFLQWEWSNRPT